MRNFSDEHSGILTDPELSLK